MRIAQAEMDKDYCRVKRLQRSLVRSWQARALAVRRVTENRGKRTSGIDRELWDWPQKKCHRRVHALSLEVTKPVQARGL